MTQTTELPIHKFRICQLKMCAAIAAELSRQCPGITTEQSQMGAIIKAADLVCDSVEKQAKDIRPVVHWNSPETIPDVPKGETKTFWLATRYKRRGEWVEVVFDAQYVNKPLEYAEDDDEKEWPLDDDHFVNEDGEPIEATGWHSLMEHADFHGYYEPVVFGDDREFLGWAEYQKPEFKG